MECWTGFTLVMVGCAMGARAGQGSCECEDNPGVRICCTFPEIFFVGILLFILVFSIAHSFVFYQRLHTNVVLSYQGEKTAKTIKGKVLDCEKIPRAIDDYYVTILYKREGRKYRFTKNGREHIPGEKIKLRVLRGYPRSAWPVDDFDRRFKGSDTVRWGCPLVSLMFLGGIPSIIYYLNYTWATNFWAIGMFAPAACIFSRRRCISVQNQVFNYATPVDLDSLGEQLFVTSRLENAVVPDPMVQEIEINAV